MEPENNSEAILFLEHAIARVGGHRPYVSREINDAVNIMRGAQRQIAVETIRKGERQ